VRQARERWPTLRTLYITGFADLASAEQQIAGEPILKKPFRLNDLTAAVDKAITHGQGTNSSVVQLSPSQHATDASKKIRAREH
jgi:DNA-binding NtrC family response regulator